MVGICVRWVTALCVRMNEKWIFLQGISLQSHEQQSTYLNIICSFYILASSLFAAHNSVSFQGLADVFSVFLDFNKT